MALLRVDPGLIIWLWITFGIILLILRLTVWGRITGALDARSNKIAADLDSARQAGEKATAVLAEYDQKIREGRAEAARIIESSRGEATRLKEDVLRQSQEEVREARWDLVSDLDGRGPEYAPILARLLVSQETGPGAAGSDDSRVLTYAVNALSGWPIEGVEAFGRYLETARADSEIACSIVDALCLMGAADGLTVLQKAEGLTLPLPKDEGGADSPPEPFDVRVHRAEVYIKVRNAADPVAAFRALPPADRKVLFGWQLAATFTKEDLQAFLLDGICADTPERLLAAFYWRDARSHLSQKCLECKDKCDTIRRLFPPGSQPPAPQPALTSSR